MKTAMPVLKVYMLGGFSMEYGNRAIVLKSKLTGKAGRLLAILLHASQNTGGGYGGVPREELIEMMYAKEELADAGNNLRVTVYRLKKLLADAGLPEFNYVQIENGVYRWRSPMEVYVDAADFSAKVGAAKHEADEEKRFSLLLSACRLYSGEFLPIMSEESWVIVRSVQYKEQYEYALSEACACLKKKRDYEQMLELSTAACRMYPFDEWQTIRMDALMGLNRYKEAQKFYEETAKMFFEELGISPSEKMMNQFYEMGGKIGRTYEAAGEIKENLKEEEYEEGALYLSLPSFRDEYRILRRISERTGQSIYMMVCTIVDRKGYPMEKADKLELLSGELQNALKKSLRRGDSYTKYSPSQFLVMLIGTNRENCDMIFRRIAGCFSEKQKAWRRHLEYQVSSVTEVEYSSSGIRFQKNEFRWNEDRGREDA